MYALVIMCKYFVFAHLQKEVVQHKEVRDRKSRIFSENLDCLFLRLLQGRKCPSSGAVAGEREQAQAMREHKGLSSSSHTRVGPGDGGRCLQ